MMTRNNSILALFFTLTSAVIIWSAIPPKEVSDSLAFWHKKEQGQESYFTKVEHYFLKDSKPFLHLIADNLKIYNSGQISTFDFPKGEVFLDQAGEVNFSSYSGYINRRIERIFFHGNVLIKNKEAEITADKADYSIKLDQFETFGGVKTKTTSIKTGDTVFVDSDEAVFFPKRKILNFVGDVKGNIKRKRVYEQVPHFNSDKLDIDLNLNEIKLTGDVVMEKERFKASSHNALIFLDNYNKKLKYYVLNDDVRIVENVYSKREKAYIQRKAFGEKLDGHISERKVVLTGAPKVVQGQDVIKGNKITLIEDSELIEVDDSNSRLIIND